MTDRKIVYVVRHMSGYYWLGHSLDKTSFKNAKRFVLSESVFRSQKVLAPAKRRVAIGYLIPLDEEE